MINFETINEVILRVTCSGAGEYIFAKSGAFIAGECYGGKNFKFEKVLLGPEQNALRALGGQLLRRFTGENLPLMRVDYSGDSITYFANEQQHVVVCHLLQGEVLSVESENILAFTPDCKYGVKFLGQGVISQKGLATSTLTGIGPQAFAAVLVDGNPLVISNMDSRGTLEVDPDAVVCWVGEDPSVRLDMSWKNFIGQASGESYMFEWSYGMPATVIIQPTERTSGLDVSMDGSRTGASPSVQRRITY